MRNNPTQTDNASRRSAKHNRSTNRRLRRGAPRFLAAATVALGAVSFAGAGASAESIDGEIEAWSPPEQPTSTAPAYEIPTAEDFVRDGRIRVELPEGYELPDDDATAEPASPHAEVPEAGPGRFTVDEDAIKPLDPAEIEDLLRGDDPDIGEQPGGCDDPGFAAEFPEKCPEQEPQDDPVDQPSETPTTVDGNPGTTVPGQGGDEPEPEVRDSTETAAEELAFTGSGPLLPLLGAGLLGTGAVVAGLSLAARRRSASQPGA